MRHKTCLYVAQRKSLVSSSGGYFTTANTAIHSLRCRLDTARGGKYRAFALQRIVERNLRDPFEASPQRAAHCASSRQLTRPKKTADRREKPPAVALATRM